MSDKLTREEQKAIAIEHLKTLGIYNQYVRKFEKDGTVTLFRRFGGYYVDETQNQDVLKIIKDFEAETGSLVYAVTEEFFEFGHCYSMLVVSPYKDDVVYGHIRKDKAPLFNVYAYVHNCDAPYCSEYGTVCIQSLLGGITRVA